VYLPSASFENLMWNFQSVLDIIDRHSDCVTCYLNGHDHDGGSALHPNGVFHLTFPGIVETADDSNAYATVAMYRDRLDIVGTGRVASYSVQLKFPITDV
jgi:manganese-dependent ADP-ribose/CDP-alcohol diphosphatase